MGPPSGGPFFCRPFAQRAVRFTGPAGGSTGSMLSFGGGRSFGGSRPGRRVQVYGCSPGCLLLSLGVSIVLTILLNVLIRLL